MANETLKRHNRYSTEWQFAKKCWNSLVVGDDIPDVPLYQLYEVNENTGKEKLIKELPITPMKVTYQGRTFFG